MLYVGIDVGKYRHEMGMVNENGTRIEPSFPFLNTTEGAESLFHSIQAMNPTQERLLIGMESTGHYWLPLYSYLHKKGYDLQIINPLQTDGMRRNLSLRKIKTDRVDAFLIAEYVRFGRTASMPVLQEQYRSLRQLCRFRSTLVDTCSDCKRQAIGILDQVFPEYASLFSDIFGKTSQERLQSYTTPEEIAQLSTPKLTHFLTRVSKGRLGKDKARALRKAAKNSFGTGLALDAFSFQLKLILKQIQFTEEHVGQVEERIQEELSHLPDTVIQTIPGVGPVVGATLVGEIGDIHRFATPHKLVAYAGFDASVKESGEFKGTRNHISKRGSRFLRRSLWLAAVVTAYHDPVLSAFYQKKREEGKAYGTAIGAVARKLTCIVWAVLTKKQPYEIRIPVVPFSKI
jgi:transposase